MWFGIVEFMYLPIVFLQLMAICVVVILCAFILVVFLSSTMLLIHVAILAVLAGGACSFYWECKELFDDGRVILPL